MKIPLFRAIVTCTPPAKFGARFRVGRHFPAGATEVLDLTQEEIDRLRSDVLAEDVTSVDRKTKETTLTEVAERFCVGSEVQRNGGREGPDPAAPALPADRLPTGPEILSMLFAMQQKLDALAQENAALKAPAPAAEPEPAKPSKAK